MPKLKTRKSFAKRFKLTKRGKVRRQKAGRGHLLAHKSRKRKRNLRRKALVAATEAKTVRQLMPWG